MVGVREQLEVLLGLQSLDTVLDDLHERRRVILERIEAGKVALKEQGRRLEEQKKAADELLRSRRQEEIELEAKSQELKKLQTRLYEVKTNKEYQAMQTEISMLKDSRAQVEEQILGRLVKEDEMKVEIGALQAEMKQFEAEAKHQEQQMTRELEAVDAETASKQSERDRVAGQIEPKVLDKYDKVRKSKGGVALANLQGGTCSACHMSIRPQLVIDVGKHKDLVLCDSCGRILYDI